MSWHELRILRDDTERENLRKQTADNLPLDAPPSSKVNALSTKLSVKEKYRRSLLGKLAKDLDYLENLVTSVTLADDETINYSFTKTTNHKSSLPRSRSLGNIGSSKRESYFGAARKEQKRFKSYGIGVRREAQDAILFLKNRQEFWSQLRPMYCENP